MKIAVVCLLPEMFTALNYGIPGRAQQKSLIELSFYNPRAYTNDKHHTVDDRPYGGGPGMVMMVEPLKAAICAAKQALGSQAKVIYLSPQGQRLTQSAIKNFVRLESVIFLAGRYEGVDERLIDTLVDEEWSLGDYVISGGELAAMVMIDAMIRLVPGALGEPQSAVEDSFTEGLLDYPHYTRPEVIEGLAVPSVLLSGDHQAIARWRKQQALGRTWQRRPDLLTQITLESEQQQLLNEFIQTCVGAEKP